MMRSGNYSWMMGGAWRTMSRQDWQRLQRQWLGTPTPAAHSGGINAWAIAAIALAALLVATLAFLVVRRRPSSRPPPTATPS